MVVINKHHVVSNENFVSKSKVHSVCGEYFPIVSRGRHYYVVSEKTIFCKTNKTNHRH